MEMEEKKKGIFSLCNDMLKPAASLVILLHGSLSFEHRCSILPPAPLSDHARSLAAAAGATALEASSRLTPLL